MLHHRLKTKALHRARIIRGQIDGLVKAIDEEKYCVDLITQSRAIQSSLKSMDRILLENHLQKHVKQMLDTPKQESKVIRELVGLYTLSNK